MLERSPRAILWQAGGDSATICLPSRLSRVRVPSPALFSEPSLYWLTTGRFVASRRFYVVRKGVQRHPASFCVLPHEKSAFVLFTNPPPLEVGSNSATRSPLCSCSFAQGTEVAIMRSLRQIVHE